MKKDKSLAFELLKQKQSDFSITYEFISEKTGYSKRQLIRLYNQLSQNEDTQNPSPHANTGKEPINKAYQSEIDFLIRLKVNYPVITIAQFRDIFIEDFVDNPEMTQLVSDFHLVHRSPSWFRNLFIQQGWKSPENRRVLRRDGRAAHPLRTPSAQRGMLIQIDGTPYDWFGTGELWTLHLAVDDATSEVLAGFFMPTERQLGYCIILRIILLRYGIPMALYSDKHSIFLSHKEGNLTQFGMMMEDLGIEMIYANSSQAKGRVERYNGTVQRRLPNDIKRFKIQNYEELNEWFNSFYIPYINRKFSFIPLDPNDAFIPLDGAKIDDIFSLRHERTIQNDIFSLNGIYYGVIDEQGNLQHIINGTKIQIRINVFTEAIFVLRYGKKYAVKQISDRKRKPSKIADNQKDLQEILNQLRKGSKQ